MYKILYWLFFAKIKMASCAPESNKSGFGSSKNKYSIEQIGLLPSDINESSGIIKVPGKNTFYTINDGGGLPVLYEINIKGNFIGKTPIPNAKNTDWEDLTVNNGGDIFIGDFGNNNNRRKDLTIYKFSPELPSNITTIKFSYADQKDFPPSKRNLNFDCEAFFAFNDSLYLFSKNRGNNMLKMYVLPQKAGEFIVSPKTKIFVKSMVTAAAVSPNGKQFVLLSYGKLFFFGIEGKEIDFSAPQYCVKLALKQAEAITYNAENELIITNEQRQVYKVVLK